MTRARRGPQALSGDRRQARPTALRGSPAPAAGAFKAVRLGAPERPELHAPELHVHERRPHTAWPGPGETDVERALRATASLLRRRPSATRPAPVSAGLTWAVHDDVARLRGILRLDSDECAEALLHVDLEWLSRYARPEETAEAAARLPDDLHELPLLAPLVKTPRWRRLNVAPPRITLG